jgi:hypothetical protein
VKIFLQTSVIALLSIPFAAEPADAQCTGSGNTTITGTSASGIGTLAWTNPNDIGALDGSYATATTPLSTGTTITNYLTATGLGFSIPVGNTVCGVGVTIQRLASSSILGETIDDNTVSLINGGVITGTNEANTTTAWPTSVGAASYGGALDTWGLGLTPAAVNAANFGVAIAADLKATLIAVSFSAEVDEVTVTVYSQPPVLAITLQNFEVTGAIGGNLLTWEIPEGMTVTRCIIERSANGQNFTPLDSVDADAQQGAYSYTDVHPLPGANYYRLHLLDADGSLGYSVMAAIVSKTVGGVQVFPNPFHSDLDVITTAPFSRLSLTTVDGQVLFKKEYPGGVTSASVGTAGLSPGLYLLSVDGKTYRVLKN